LQFCFSSSRSWTNPPRDERGLLMNITSHPLVSIVTPVYNEEEHLAECIESVLSQSYQNWDYAIINNCSTDRSLEIARRYAARDSRIRVYDNKNFLEMMPNHNVAVRQISPFSKYCKMVLADDRIFPRCLERMVAVAEAYPSVGVVSAYEQCGEQVRITGLPAKQTLVEGREACRQFLLGRLLLFGSQNSVLYRADLVRSRDPFYVETEMYADFEVCFALLSDCDLGFVHEISTFSRPRVRSAGAVSADTGAQFGSMLGILFNYGRDCLTSQEFEESLDRLLSEYYRFLGRRLFVERNGSFWSYHRKTLAKRGIGLDGVRLARASLGQLCGSLTDPKSTLESVKRFFSLREIRNIQIRGRVMGFGTGVPKNGDRPIGGS
jgi:glycosyltransferase involved in cell wall biosynthesis